MSFRLPAIATMVLLAAITAFPRQSANAGADQEHTQAGAQNSVPSVEQHLKVLSEKLDLSTEQEDKIKPALQQLHETATTLMQDKSLSREERFQQLHAAREKADANIRQFLNDEQKSKLTALEHEPHSGLHGNGSSASERQK